MAVTERKTNGQWHVIPRPIFVGGQIGSNARQILAIPVDRPGIQYRVGVLCHARRPFVLEWVDGAVSLIPHRPATKSPGWQMISAEFAP